MDFTVIKKCSSFIDNLLLLLYDRDVLNQKFCIYKLHLKIIRFITVFLVAL